MTAPEGMTSNRAWRPAAEVPGHPLQALDGLMLDGGRVRVFLGPTSRFGAQYFALYLERTDGARSEVPLLQGLHRTGPLPSYNWVEVAQTAERIPYPDGSMRDVAAQVEALLRRIVELLPPGGHLMVEYDSQQRAETARALAHGVPAIATPLGELLFRIGCGPKFKDWQIAEGGSEGPRKLQAYKALSEEHARRWREEACQELEAFLKRTTGQVTSDIIAAARERATRLLTELRGD